MANTDKMMRALVLCVTSWFVMAVISLCIHTFAR